MEGEREREKCHCVRFQYYFQQNRQEAYRLEIFGWILSDSSVFGELLFVWVHLIVGVVVILWYEF